MSAFDKKPVDLRRRLPLAVPCPQHEILRTEITVPATWTSWTFQKESKKIMDPAFVFLKQTHRAGKKVILEYEYRSLSDSVPANRVAEYLQNLDQMSKCFGNSFFWK